MTQVCCIHAQLPTGGSSNSVHTRRLIYVPSTAIEHHQRVNTKNDIAIKFCTSPECLKLDCQLHAVLYSVLFRVTSQNELTTVKSTALPPSRKGTQNLVGYMLFETCPTRARNHVSTYSFALRLRITLFLRCCRHRHPHISGASPHLASLCDRRPTVRSQHLLQCAE